MRWRGLTSMSCALALQLGCAPGWSDSAPGPDEKDGRPNLEPETGEEDGGPGPGECGNGLHEPGESCDDANPTWGDGCNPDCSLGGDLRWRDMLELGPWLIEVDDAVVAADGSVVVATRGGSAADDRLTLAWRADGTPAWVRRPEWLGTQYAVARQLVVSDDRTFVIDPGYTVHESEEEEGEAYLSWYLHIEELDADGELLRDHQLILPASTGANVGYRAEMAEGNLLVMSEGEDRLVYASLDLVSGDWTTLEESELTVENWGALRDHLPLADGTELFLVGTASGTLNRLYRVGADRSVSEWTVFGSDTPPSLHLREDTVLLLHQPDFWSAPYVYQYDFSGELINGWSMYYPGADGEGGFGDFANTVSTPVGVAEWVFVDRSNHQILRQAMDGEARWFRLLENWDLDPARVTAGPAFEDDTFVVGQWIDPQGERHVYVECRAP